MAIHKYSGKITKKMLALANERQETFATTSFAVPFIKIENSPIILKKNASYLFK